MLVLAKLSDVGTDVARTTDHARVAGLVETTLGVRIYTNKGELSAGKVIISTGVWTQELLPRQLESNKPTVVVLN